MHEEDLARPVIEVRDLDSEKLLYEVYSFGEQIVVVPVSEEEKGIYKLASKGLEEELRKLFPGLRIKAKVISDNRAIIYVPPSAISSVIGKKGKRIADVESIVGMSLDVEPLGRERIRDERIEVEVEMKKKTIRLHVGEFLAHQKVSVFADSQRLFDVTVSREGYINLRKTTANGKKIINALRNGEVIYVVPL
jgi:ATPase